MIRLPETPDVDKILDSGASAAKEIAGLVLGIGPTVFNAAISVANTGKQVVDTTVGNAKTTTDRVVASGKTVGDEVFGKLKREIEKVVREGPPLP